MSMGARDFGPPVPEWRFDPITEDAVIIAEGRAARPVDHVPPPAPAPSQSCPFCEGREGTTPPEIAVRRAAGTPVNGPGWRVRVIPNKFPTFVSGAPGPAPFSSEGSALFHSAVASGTHEVVIQSPTHGLGVSQLPPGQVREILDVYRARLRALEAAGEARSLALVENWGVDSGGSLTHPHGQILGTPVVLPALERTLRGTSARARDWHAACPVEHLLGEELSAQSRIIAEQEHFVALAPYASTVPYQVRVVPRRHARSLSEAHDRELDSLSVLLPRLERALLEIFPGTSYNLVALFPARPEASTGPFHWTADLLPRLVKEDGFELAARVAVNPIAPEAAAARYREHLVP